MPDFDWITQQGDFEELVDELCQTKAYALEPTCPISPSYSSPRPTESL